MSARRLFLVSALVLLVPAILGITALSYQRPDPPPQNVGPSFPVLAQATNPTALAAQNRSRTATRLAAKLTKPALLAPIPTRSAEIPALPTLALTGVTATAIPTLALAPRARPYTLLELSRAVPEAFTMLDRQGATGGALLLKADLLVPVGAALVIDGRTPDVRLTSSAAGFVTIISRGTLSVGGDVSRPVRISSWDPVKGGLDRNASDGRSFVEQIGGRMDVRFGVFESLGFDLGVTSGVAWVGTWAGSTTGQPIKARGDVTDSQFLSNRFGAYTRIADGMHWLRNTFAYNDEYGFDPHDFSNNFVVEGNTAFGNGKHGFIFSRGCMKNLLRYNVAHDNAGHGFMIDDGRSRPGRTIRLQVDDSSDNVLVGNYAFANDGNGIEMEGGTGNVVSDNKLVANFTGVRIKDQGSATVRDNSLTDNLRYGIDVRNTQGTITVTGNIISGSWGAVGLAKSDVAVLNGNVVSDVSAELVVDGAPVRTTTWTEHVGAFLRWNPMLLLWSLVAGVPILMALLRLVTGRTRARRHRILS